MTAAGLQTLHKILEEKMHSSVNAQICIDNIKPDHEAKEFIIPFYCKGNVGSCPLTGTIRIDVQNNVIVSVQPKLRCQHIQAPSISLPPDDIRMIQRNYPSNIIDTVKLL